MLIRHHILDTCSPAFSNLLHAVHFIAVSLHAVQCYMQCDDCNVSHAVKCIAVDDMQCSVLVSIVFSGVYCSVYITISI